MQHYLCLLLFFSSHTSTASNQSKVDYIQTETRDGGQGTCRDHSVGEVTVYRHGDREVSTARTFTSQKKDMCVWNWTLTPCNAEYQNVRSFNATDHSRWSFVLLCSNECLSCMTSVQREEQTHGRVTDGWKNRRICLAVTFRRTFLCLLATATCKQFHLTKCCPETAEDFPHPVRTGRGAHPTSSTLSIIRSLLRVTRPGRGVDHPPLTSAKIKEIFL